MKMGRGLAGWRKQQRGRRCRSAGQFCRSPFIPSIHSTFAAFEVDERHALFRRVEYPTTSRYSYNGTACYISRSNTLDAFQPRSPGPFSNRNAFVSTNFYNIFQCIEFYFCLVFSRFSPTKTRLLKSGELAKLALGLGPSTFFTTRVFTTIRHQTLIFV